MDWDPLVEAASSALENSYAPYSGFKVGAAVLSPESQIFAGCNVENRSFGSTICAERTAIVNAVAAGVTKLEAVAVITDTDPPAPPCGMCLQVLVEFGRPDLPILLVNLRGVRVESRLSDFHPHPFKLPKGGLGLRSEDSTK